VHGHPHRAHQLVARRLAEIGFSIPLGARRGIGTVRQALAASEPAVAALLTPWIEDTLAENAALEERSTRIEHGLAGLTRDDAIVRELPGIPGFGLLED
jgi:hypothetical protein